MTDPTISGHALHGVGHALGDGVVLASMIAAAVTNGAPAPLIVALIVIVAGLLLSNAGAPVTAPTPADPVASSPMQESSVVFATRMVDRVLADVRDWLRADTACRSQIVVSWCLDEAKLLQILEVGRAVAAIDRLSTLFYLAADAPVPRDRAANPMDDDSEAAHAARALYASIYAASGREIVWPGWEADLVLRDVLTARIMQVCAPGRT